MIEAVVSVALLATAGIALARLSQNASVLNQQSDDRVSLTLTAENTLERLRVMPDENLTEKADQIATAMSDSGRCNVEIDVDEFDGPAGRGLHLVVTATDKRSQRVRLHDWRITTAGESSGADKDEN